LLNFAKNPIAMKKVLVFIAQGSEEMEAVIVIDILRRAGIDVLIAGESWEIVSARRTKIIPDALIDNLNENDLFDLVYVPGGSKGVENLAKIQKVGSILEHNYINGKYIAAICAGPLVLDHFGILQPGQKLTSHPDTYQHLQKYDYSQDKIVEDNRIITSRGAGTAIDFALYLVKLLNGKDESEKVAQAIVYLNQ